ncbi:MAG: DUF3006 domain-containing protein [Oscillospiraceae bacterium]|nr:DUF3006 domain-containing protein [Oscillospiraceae bacterium]
MGKLYTVDRFEENIAVLENEDGSHINAPRSLISGNAQEGDILERVENGYIIREDLTRERRERIIGKQKRLFRHRSDET